MEAENMKYNIKINTSQKQQQQKNNTPVTLLDWAARECWEHRSRSRACQ